MKDDLKAPTKSQSDMAHSAVKAGLSAIPCIGGAASELFQYVVQAPLEKRRDAWMAAVGEKLLELDGSTLKVDALGENDAFVSAAMHASQIALRSHQQEKLEALRNAVVNIATGHAPEEVLQHLFLGFVDSLTPTHLQILKHFQSPPNLGRSLMGSLSSVLETGFPELRGRRAIYDQLWRDLHTRGLVSTDGLHANISGQGLLEKRTTELGDQFLKFISDENFSKAKVRQPI